MRPPISLQADYTLYNACDAVGIPRRSPHKIRKTYASILLDNNVAPKLIIETMGHTDISTTNGSYARRKKTAIGSNLLQLAKANTPTMLYFGSQPGVEGFYEKNGCKKGMQSYTIEKKRK